MSAAPGLRPSILEAKERLLEGREKVRRRQEKGSPGLQVCAAITELFDSTLLGLYQDALVDLGEAEAGGLGERVALVAHGGYGRRDVAPHSDIDLMILHRAEDADRVSRIAQRMLRDVFDVGLTLGQSMRTPREALRLAMQDATVCTSLIESRLLIGDQELFDGFVDRFRRSLSRSRRARIATIEAARAAERTQYGETVYLLEPNLKRTRGGLRDLQLLRWVGYVQHGTPELDGLRLHGALSRSDHDRLLQAWDFLLRVRNEMHFHHGKPHDVLDRAEQMRLAEAFGFEGTEGLLPVEQFMRDYFGHTESVSHIVSRFIATAKSPPRWIKEASRLFCHRFEGDFLVGPFSISANRRGLEKLGAGGLSEILRLAVIANLYNKPIAHSTLEAIRTAAPETNGEIDPKAAERFLTLLDHTGRLGGLLRDLHQMGVLEKIIPAFKHARGLLQFNDYHKYTVDEHSLRAVEHATEFIDDEGPVGRVYRQIKRKWLLHLALLIHDLGKGYIEDHSDVGLRIAEETARRLHLSESNAETLKFLVHKHLIMSHLAFRRDTSDNQLIVRFAVEVGSPDHLQMLFVLTCADLAAVGPDVLNAWKIDVLANLYHRTMRHLAPDAPSLFSETRSADRRAEVLAALDAEETDVGWFKRQVAALPAGYLKSTAVPEIVEKLRQWRRLAPGEAHAEGCYQPENGVTEYRISTHEDVTPGVFHKLCGALASRGLQILSAEINTMFDGLIFDRFFVLDPENPAGPPSSRIDDVCGALVASLRGEGKPPVFRRLWQPRTQRSSSELAPLPTQVRTDNHTSDRYTIIDVFAADRTGLLYVITRTLFELGLSVAVAKIGTYLDQVVDVFYVTDAEGRKIHDEERLREIRERLLHEIEQHARQEASRVKAS